MTTEEFSNAFTVLLNSYTDNAEFGEQNSKMNLVLNEYEKSLLLTKAQELIVTELYDNQITAFEESEQLRRILSPLIRTVNLEVYNWDYSIPDIRVAPISDNSYGAVLPDNLMFITLEQAIVEDNCGNDVRINVQPVKQDEFNKIKENPFRGCTFNRVLRLDIHDNCVELVSSLPIKSYVVRYLKRPNPIILEDLPENLSIDGLTEAQTSELDPSIHNKIIERAVLLAVTSNKITNAK